MFERLRSPLIAKWLSAAAVVAVSWIVGRYAAEGMNPVQWMGGALAVAGTIALAVIVRTPKEIWAISED
ncbi:hypothetical protein C5708_13770 [Caulobacter sp. CCUG 60055]|uniref:hypothetical protein n=1 Tax=Caulobacter sp. CCUG 60055 TaxID=2100090 RepID=UPI001FA6B680|nr:hypothetical protein [Caulobacter sp. CCUG 60055]MBQ1543544.1 hypothetical protein [Caulobacteraceae bacterium]MCI3181320.1 hypothetical protein [Caulobacter sp. CCUG 60055]